VKRETDLLDRIGVQLDPEQRARLGRFGDLLSSRAVDLGALAAGDRDRVMERHVVDSLRAAPLLRPGDRIAYDLGSGAGLPGVPLSIACPWCTFVLVEPRHRRAAFLELVADELGLNVRVERARAEDMAVPGDLVLSRAFVALPRAWALAAPLLHPGGRLVYFAGERLQDPAEAAREAAGGEVRVEVLPSVLERSGPLVIMERP